MDPEALRPKGSFEPSERAWSALATQNTKVNMDHYHSSKSYLMGWKPSLNANEEQAAVQSMITQAKVLTGGRTTSLLDDSQTHIEWMRHPRSQQRPAAPAAPADYERATYNEYTKFLQQ